MDNQAGGEPLSRQRQAGVCLHITSLPGHYGIGELGDSAYSFIDSMVRMNLKVWQYLPIGPTAYADSPYQPLSTFAGNELLIDTALLIRSGLLTSNEADSLLPLSKSNVDFGMLIPKKSALLTRAAGRFNAHASSGIKAEFEQFLHEYDTRWLHDYAMFRVLKAMHNEQPWPSWKSGFVHRDTAAMRNLVAMASPQIENIKILQFLFQRQWQQLRNYAVERGVLLFGDMPIYIALDSSDAWANRELLDVDSGGKPNFVAGVPPDYFSADGQLWGNPLYLWEKHASSDFRWWIDRAQSATQQADIVRIDHFRGFESYWSVPFGSETARIGEWVPGPGAALFDALRRNMGRLPFVAENLGVITPEVEALRTRYGLPGMRVLQFEVANDVFDVSTIDAACVCYTGTHDNDTTAGWFHGGPGDTRSAEQVTRDQATVLRNTGANPATIAKDMIRFAFSTNASLAIVPLQDILGLGSGARLNVPGTSSGNWRWRMQGEQLTPAVMDSIASSVQDSGRSTGALAH
jgi:4-alpha-glucanotransferase